MTNSEFKVELERRTVMFSVSVIRALRGISPGLEAKNIREQVMRSATSVGANYREANRAESEGDFSHKIAVAAKESAETEYWLLVLNELFPGIAGIEATLQEAGELTRIFDRIRRTISSRTKPRKDGRQTV